jgi:DNA-binding NarL/FixJ family response regulator
MPKSKIMIVDDHEVVRLGLISLLEQNSQYEIVAQADNALDAIKKVETQKPDIVLMDIRLPGMSGIEACEQICKRFPET